MANNTDATLRIRAKNLASKTLKEVGSDLDQLAKSQFKNSKATDLAQRNIADLKEELTSLQAVAKELERRGTIAAALRKDKDEIGKTQQRIRALNAELNRLSEVKASGEKVKGLGNQILQVNRKIAAANRELQRQVEKFTQASTEAGKLGISASRTAQAITKINQESQRTAALIERAEASMEGYAQAVRNAREAQREQQRLQREINAEAERRNRIEAEGQRAFRNAARERKAALDREIAQREQRQKDLEFAFNGPAILAKGQTFGPAGDPVAVRRAQQEAEASALRLLRLAEQRKAVELGPGGDPAAIAAAKAAAREAGVRERLINVLNRQRDAGERLLRADGQLAAATDRVTRALRVNTASLDRNNNATGLLADTGRKSLSVYQRIRGQILATAAAYVGLYQAVNLVRSAVTVEQERRRIDIQLQTANKGNAEAAARDVAFLRKAADDLGLIYEDIAKNYANFKIAGEAVGASNKTIRQSFLDATKIVTGLGLSAEDADGVFRAFVQIMGKARVQAEELRGQLGDRLPGAVAKFAEANKIALTDLDKYLKDGEGNVQNFLTFLQAYAKSVDGAVKQNSNTLFAQFNRLTNAYRDFLANFAKAGASKELLNVVNALIAKLNGEDGGKFAKDLAAAFTAVAKVMLFVIENFDSLVKVLKLFLALQVAKAAYGITTAFVRTAIEVFGAVKAMKEFATAAFAARAAGAALTVTQRALLALCGPLGIGIAAVAGTIWLLGKRSRETQAELDRLIEKTNKLRTLQGSAGVAGIRDAANEIRTLAEEEKELLEKRANLLKARAEGEVDPLAKLIDAAADTTLSLEGVEQRLKQVRAEIDLLKNASVAASKRLIKDAEARKKAAEEEAKQTDDFATGTDDSDAEDKARKAREAAEKIAEARRDIADRAAREILEIEEALAEARKSTEISTQAQIDANLQASLDKIAADIAQKRIQLEGLKRDAERIGSAAGANNAQTALDNLPGLEKARQDQARRQAIIDSIELKERNINAIIAERDALIENVNAQMEVGLIDEVTARERVNGLMLEYKTRITDAILALQMQLEALKASNPDLAAALNVDTLLAKLEAVKTKAGEVQTTAQRIGQNLGSQFAGGATDAIVGLGLAIAGLGDGFVAARDGFRNFLADFLIGIAKAIIQAILLQAIMNAINGTKGGYGGAVKKALGAGHTGGIVKSNTIGNGRNPMRYVMPAIFEGAQRFHQGGFPGLAPNEVPAILKKKEEVLTENDPRNALNGGLTPAAAQQPMDVTVVNQIDSGQMVETGLRTRRGKKEVLNVIAADAPALRKILGIKS